MRKLCHISFSSHKEVMFRSEEDINYAFNCLAVAALETESRMLADSEMTTHVHFGTFTDCAEHLFTRFRYPYSRYFNSKYGRRGRLGERHAFYLNVDGLQHSQTLLSYIFRQAHHHGLSDTPFGYKHNSINVIFSEALGKKRTYELTDRYYMTKYLPCPASKIPDGYRMSDTGLLLREDVIDSSYVEELYISPRNFLYQMNRLSSDKWLEEQTADNNGLPPVSLESIEPECFKPTLQQMLINESGRNFRNDITDLELCGLIDTFYLERIKRHTIYEINDSGRATLGNTIYTDLKSGKISKMLGRNAGLPDIEQIKRCAAIL